MCPNLQENREFYAGRKVLVTGHTGFKGAWLTAMLHDMGASVVGYALPAVPGSLYDQMAGDRLLQSIEGDLADAEHLQQVVADFQPEVVLHLAAFGFIPECYADPVRAYQTNVLGSVHLLEALRPCEAVRSIVLVSTDKVYANHGEGTMYTEQAHLGGVDPYSASKVYMEFAAADYRDAYFAKAGKQVGVATARASNVLGGGDHIQSRLVPSILRAVATQQPMTLRNPDQTRPWQSVLDALNGYLTLGRYLYQQPQQYAGAWNIGPGPNGVKTVGWVYEQIKRSFNGLSSQAGAPLEVAESAKLGLSIDKILQKTDWRPLLSTEELLGSVVEFYQRQCRGEAARTICMEQVQRYFERR